MLTGPITYTAKFGSSVQDVEITDSWDTIIANIDNGTYATKYKVGNYKPLDLGTEGTINMQIVAFDSDKLASSGTAPITFVAKELLNTSKRINNANVTSFRNSELDVYLQNDIYALIPENVRQRINSVKKYTTVTNANDYNTSYSYTTKIFIPSLREVYSTYGGENKESSSSAVVYKKIYKDNNSRIKHKSGDTTAITWWLRTRYSKSSSSNTFTDISSNGGAASQSCSITQGICIGFCLGLASS